ncbi:MULTISPECIES: prephenate dehydratase domain-containing protein [Candidatus Neomicrothrix]|jgi:prephenate dehydratase/prephenate dehydrogenase|uniref:Putative Prephenate dehydratase n=1 Tax=Candidatus Neomicrothrix parvicella RN1 TaxID=1229780 RepID=R4Z2Y3_9ACTN|nr:MULTISPECIES: prephenate dehydratase domain-containing protein [Microthrix]MBK6502816.1 prephenate dehydrogenase/arogenate dehydrogenase family protein [Candidatus Microthrix sp.]MBK7021379.1 prephenate dehydrogenase/arogenate dehydrogenase family protein [Candidatus Microthrix sp.]MBL0205031.1 prephenate dehydrogenase/arogenate dehydrogenase family protein [Candidatus Microthrix sp.]MBP6134824.1 prephenate dehydrogenase/arogenate dehydrogenase family protein [Candidatus Microthrix sp.]MBP6
MPRPSPDLVAGNNRPDGLPARLVIFGAAQGMGRWLAEQVFANVAMQLVLVDVSHHVFEHPVDRPWRRPPLRLKVAYEDGRPVFTDVDGTTAPSPLDPPPAGRLALCLAVPADAVDTIASAVLPLPAPGSIVFDVTSSKNQPLAALRARRDDLAVFGTHPLFGPRVPGPAGQTVVVCPDPADPEAHRWLSDLFATAGTAVHEVSAEEHDQAMSWVQALTHQVLIVFAGLVSRSEPGMEELWRFRTPVFEALAGLAGRVLTPSQDSTIAAIQAGVNGSARADDLAEAVAALQVALSSGDPGDTAGFIAWAREGLRAVDLSRLQATAEDAVAAVQRLRADLAAARTNGVVVGLVPRDGSGRRPHIGTILEVTSTDVVLLDAVLGPDDAAVLVTDEPGAARAAKLGIAGKASRVTLALAGHRLLAEPELQRWLAGHLATLGRDVRLVVPPSLNGEELGRMLAALVPGLTGATVVADRWFRGDRELILRLGIRADTDPDLTRDAVVAQVEALVTPPPAAGVETVAYLGPPGTFTELAARALAAEAAGDSAALVAAPSVGAALDRLSDGRAAWAVVPVSNTLSGGVRPALEALAARSGELAVSGSQVVAVNFTAWVHPDDLGADPAGVVSHEQALAQCTGYLASLGGDDGHIETRKADSTAEACRVVADRAHPGWVALAGPTTGTRYGLVAAAEELADRTDSATTFVLVRRASSGAGRGGDRTVDIDLDLPSIRLPGLSPHEPPARIRVTERG